MINGIETYRIKRLSPGIVQVNLKKESRHLAADIKAEFEVISISEGSVLTYVKIRCEDAIENRRLADFLAEALGQSAENMIFTGRWGRQRGARTPVVLDRSLRPGDIDRYEQVKLFASTCEGVDYVSTWHGGTAYRAYLHLDYGMGAENSCCAEYKADRQNAIYVDPTGIVIFDDHGDQHLEGAAIRRALRAELEAFEIETRTS